ncbi:MAG: succinate dehydrogenase assembly factor 2 [Mariprofundus sp.]
MQEHELAIRRLRYRLNRQGMLELDAWLGGLMQAELGNVDVVNAIELLLSCEAPELQSMMHGDLPVPAVLKGWLICDCC